MGYIDADAHVIECEETWDYLDPSERQFRPVAVEVPATVGGKDPIRLYLIGETLCRRFPTDCRGVMGGAGYSGDVSHLENPSVRLRDMDAVGIDVQILISTNFIAAEIDNPLAEAAITRAWNRWMADRTADSGGRLRWAVVPPIRTMDRALAELEFGKAHGAAAVMLKGIQHGMYLSDPYFYPLYEKAQDLDLTILVHQGAKRDHVEGLGIANPKTSPAIGFHYTATTAQGFYAILASDIYKRFPRLRFAIVEAGSTWAPAVFQHYKRGSQTQSAASFIMTEEGPTRRILPLKPAELMEERNLYITCEDDEDLPYITSILGDSHLCMGTDWCHNDSGSDPLAHTHVMNRTDISKAVARKIVDDNGRRAFGIPADFRPTERLKVKEKTPFILGQF